MGSLAELATSIGSAPQKILLVDKMTAEAYTQHSLMTINLTLGSAILVLIGYAAIQFLAAEWIKACLQKSIEHEYQKKLEEFRYDIKVREQAAKVAEYLALRASNTENVTLMNKLSWELAMWLPAEIYQQMAHVVVGRPNAQEYKQLIIAVRKLLLKNPSDPLTWDNIIHTLV